jgi:hypothetical protein
MPAFHRASLLEFIHASDSEITGILSLAYARAGYTDQKAAQTISWHQDLRYLKEALVDLHNRKPEAGAWTILFEFEIPRKSKRIDVVLLAADTIVLLEQKSQNSTAADRLQAEEYALLLHYFHAPSNKRTILPIVVSPSEPRREPIHQGELPYWETAAFWIAPVARAAWRHLAQHLASIAPSTTANIDPLLWETGEYRPVPSIIEATLALRDGLEIGEIAQSSAARHDVAQLTAFIQEKVAEARDGGLFTACFITGVPGSGKTLVGLNLAFSKQSGAETIHFMSGTGPLVAVLQAVLARYEQQRGVRALDAKHHAQSQIENVHVFARTYTDDPQQRAPSNHVIIFDEAQRAWNRDQNLAKFKRPYSEPQMLLEIMERHQDWAMVIALVGGGQEINTGEAGLEEWGRSLSAANKSWIIYASPEAISGGASVAGSRISSEASTTLNIRPEPQLHLGVSVRSLKAEAYAAWVNHVVEGEAAAAYRIRQQIEFPILITRDLTTLRKTLRHRATGESRFGLVASSQAARLRAEGLEPDSTFHAGYPWEHWYLAPNTDVRSSFQAEVFATEFEIQGLELDWIGLCWGGDFIRSRSEDRWMIRRFRAAYSRWSEEKSDARRMYRRNAYRVLLTRARKGIVIYVPTGDPSDPTRDPREMDATASFLIACGARLIDPTSNVPNPTSTPNPSLFD